VEQTVSTTPYVQPSKRIGRIDFLASSLFVLVLASLVGITACADPGGVSLGDSRLLYVANLLAIALLMLIAARSMRPTRATPVPLLHPPMLMTAWFLFVIAIPGLALFTYPANLLALRLPPDDYYAYLAPGMTLCLAGLTALWIGYSLGLTAIQPARVLRFLGDRSPSLLAILALYTLTIAVRLARIMVTGIAFGADSTHLGPLLPFDQWLKYIEDSRYLILAVTASQIFGRRWPWPVLVLMVTMEILYAFTSGFMKPLLWVIVVLLLSLVYRGFNLKRCIPYLVPTVLIAITIVPVAQELRLSFRQFDSRSPVQVWNATQEAFGSTWGKGIGIGWAAFTQKSLLRQTEVAQMPAVILMTTPSVIPFEGFQQFAAIPAYVIPRAVWPDKPVLSRGIWFGITYLNNPTTTTTSRAMTIFGESYIFGGWLGTILASLCLGLLLALLVRSSVGIGLTSVYIALVPTFIDVESQLTVMTVTLIQGLAIYLFLYYVLTIRLRRSL